MTAEPTAKKERETEHDGSPDGGDQPTIDELLRALLVEEAKVRVDPITGRAIPGGNSTTPGEDRT